MSKVCCNNCMDFFDEDAVIWDSDEKMDFCPRCGEGGFLEDIVKGRFPSAEQVERLRGIYIEGRRVVLVQMDDPYTKLQVGDKGTIDHVDDAGGIHIRWDNGEGLAAVWGVDEVKVIN